MDLRTLLLTNIGTTNSVITDTTDCYGPIITVGGVGVSMMTSVILVQMFKLGLERSDQ